VAASGSHTASFTNWTTAAHDIQYALDVCSIGDQAGIDRRIDYTWDMEYTVRPVDSDINGRALCDIGAFEYCPLSTDTDHDALVDYEEVMTYDCNPLDPDSDTDDMQDGAEVMAGTSPTKL
jgi:hypothetical protein